MNMRVKTISISEAEKAAKEGDSSLYVVNRTEPAAMPMVSVRNDGEDQVVVIPVTWGPYDLSTAAPKEAILKSPAFRGFHARGFIAIVDTQSAEALLRTNKQALEETRRAASTVFKSSATNAGEVGGELNLAPRNAVQHHVSDTASVSPRIMTFVNQVDQGEVAAQQAIAMLANAKLTSDDKQYILTESQSSEFRDWAAGVEAVD